jgi:hypothetical protein
MVGAVLMPNGKAREIDPAVGQRAGVARALEHGAEQGGGIAGWARHPALAARIPVREDAVNDAVQLVDHAGELVARLDAQRRASEAGERDRLLRADAGRNGTTRRDPLGWCTSKGSQPTDSA